MRLFFICVGLWLYTAILATHYAFPATSRESQLATIIATAAGGDADAAEAARRTMHAPDVAVTGTTHRRLKLLAGEADTHLALFRPAGRHGHCQRRSTMACRWQCLRCQCHWQCGQ